MPKDSLDDLRSGKLAGASRLSLSCQLEHFPTEIFDLAETLEILDLSRNRLSTLPDDFGCLKRLKILFLSENRFTGIPTVLSECPDLTMIGFKSNQIEKFPEDALPAGVRWLILTDNRIEKLPDSIGKLDRLQKVMLAGNRITRLPDTMQRCKNLELLRLSANRIELLPDWLFEMPRLAWLACAGNPSMAIDLPDTGSLAEIAWEHVSLHEALGEGASGIISRAKIKNDTHAAVKIFKGSVTSDGYPSDEISASIAAGKHHNLNTPHGKITDHPEEREALVFPLIPAIYCNLGNPPSFESCTRDLYDDEALFSLPRMLRILSDVASAAGHLHQRGLNHGDLYAHNILIDEEGHSLLGDFGAATCYDKSIYGRVFEQLEVRAFGCLMEDLLERRESSSGEESEKIIVLEKLRERCLNEAVEARPLFAEIYRTLSSLRLSQREAEG